MRTRTRAAFIGVASDLGAPMAGARLSPLHLAAAGLFARWPTERRLAMVTMIEASGAPQGRDIAALARLSDRLEQTVAAIMRDANTLPVIVSGDHSSAIGTWRGVARALRQCGAVDAAPGLLWLDAHMDAHTPQSSLSGALHGMPLAVLLGEGDARLLMQPAPLDPAHVVLVGVHSFESAEADRLARLGVRIHSRAEVRDRTLAVVLNEALLQVRASSAGWGLTLDMDVIDPDEAPGVNTLVPGGLSAAELIDALSSIAGGAGGQHPGAFSDEAARPGRLLAIELTEYNPERDKGERTARLVESLLRCLLIAPRGANV